MLLLGVACKFLAATHVAKEAYWLRSVVLLLLFLLLLGNYTSALLCGIIAFGLVSHTVCADYYINALS